MKYERSITILTILILVLSLAATVYGIYSSSGAVPQQFISWSGETVELYGTGLYEHDSISGAEQEIAQDIVTLFMGIPLLILSIFLFRRGSFRGRFMLAGTLGYFLYSYTSYSFLSAYNSFFLIYVILMSASLFAFILTIISFDIKSITTYFNPKTPVKFIGGLLIFMSIAICLMWVGRIFPSIFKDTMPYGLDHYTTLVIQALDLGLIVPGGILSGLLLFKQQPYGYLLATVFIVKAFMMLTAITAMNIKMSGAGVQSSPIEIIVFSVFNAVIIYSFYLIMKNIHDPSKVLHNEYEERMIP